MTKVVDVRGAGGDYVILGNAFVLPSIIPNNNDNILDGSLRFNNADGSVELFVQGSWSPIGGAVSSAHSHQLSSIVGLQNVLNAKANAVHNHSTNEVDGLQTILNNKSNLDHTHSIASIMNLEDTLADINSDLGTLQSGKANTNHLHLISSVTGLQGILDNKTNIGHTHLEADIQGLPVKLSAAVKEQIAFCITGQPASGLRYTVMIARRIDVSQNFSGSRAFTRIWPTTNYIIQVTQNGNQAGTISINPAGIASFTTISPLGLILLEGDRLEFILPSADPTMETLSITILGEKK